MWGLANVQRNDSDWLRHREVSDERPPAARGDDPVDPRSESDLEQELDRILAGYGDDELARLRSLLIPLLDSRRQEGREPEGAPNKDRPPADGERSVHTSGEAPADASWQRLIEQLKSHRPPKSRYVFEGKVAKGGMGVIYEVYDQDVRRHLAMKVILNRGDAGKSGHTPAVDSKSLGRFLEEAQVTGQLDHPGIVPVHELGVDDNDQVYFTMKLVDGEDLRAVFDRVHRPADSGWNLTRALSLMLRVCEAMAYAHSKGVIHRDLKPSNIMVGRYGEVYVMDWGLARVQGQRDQKDLRIQPMPVTSSTAVESHRKDASETPSDSPLITMDGDVVGTPAYMSPEQARGELNRIGPQTDVYAMGAMLYHLLTGYMPYVKPDIVSSQYAVWRWVQEGAPNPLERAAPEAPAELVAICEKAMRRSPADRYANMEELAIDLRAFLENRVVAAYESGAIAELKKWVKRNKGIAATAAAAIVVLALVSWWSYSSIRSERNAALASEKFAKRNEAEALAERRRADENASLADARAREAETERRRVFRLADIKTLRDLKAEMDALWPALPNKKPAMRSWLARSEALAQNLPDHERTLSELRARGTPGPHPQEGELGELRQQAEELTVKLQKAGDGDERRELERNLTALEGRIASLSARIERERPYTFAADPRDDWWHGALVDLVSGLVAFSGDDPYGATSANVRKRLEFATSIEQRSITDRREAWDEAIASIADREECPRYDGLELRPQLGLVPLGRDPDSGLWEFWHVQTGEWPERGEDGQLVLTDEMGLVLVLIPGGTFWMGAQANDPNGRNYDPEAEVNESDGGKPIRVTVDAYFLSKYELTQGQWQRFTGENPSTFVEGSILSGQTITSLHPVDSVTWEECVGMLDRLGLSLPTEAQWEYGCRAGTETPWWTGTEKGDLDRAANLADHYLKTHGGPSSWFYEDELDDGFVLQAPVGRFRANAFGLHDVIGNNREWCLGVFAPYSSETDSGYRIPHTSDISGRVFRGGCFGDIASKARSARRDGAGLNDRGSYVGVRPARVIHP